MREPTTRSLLLTVVAGCVLAGSALPGPVVPGAAATSARGASMQAQGPRDVEDLERLVRGVEERLAGIEDLRGRFEQTREMPGDRVVARSGRFFVKPPGRMRWEYTDPKRRLFVATGERIYWYVPEDNQVQVLEPEKRDVARTPVLFLSGEGRILEEFDVYPGAWKEPLDPGHVQLELLPRRRDASFESLILEVDPETRLIRRLVKVEYIGSPIEYRFFDLEVDVGLAAELFRFTVPPGAEVVPLGG